MSMTPVKIRNIYLGDGTPKICIPLTATSCAELSAQASAVLKVPCDMVEWRADYYKPEETGETESDGKSRRYTGAGKAVGEDTEKDRAKRDDSAERKAAAWIEDGLELLRGILGDLPILFTFRTREEGGERSVPIETYRAWNLRAAESGNADLVDLELNRGSALQRELTEQIHRHGVRVIASFHDFAKTPDKESLLRTIAAMQVLGADITKIAVMPQTERDVLTLLDATLALREGAADRPYITMSMSARGGMTRLCGSLTGSAVTFATAGCASAPGQMDAEFVRRVIETLSYSKEQVAR